MKEFLKKITITILAILSWMIVLFTWFFAYAKIDNLGLNFTAWVQLKAEDLQKIVDNIDALAELSNLTNKTDIICNNSSKSWETRINDWNLEYCAEERNAEWVVLWKYRWHWIDEIISYNNQSLLSGFETIGKKFVTKTELSDYAESVNTAFSNTSTNINSLSKAVSDYAKAVDITYARKTEIPASPDLSSYAKKTDIPDLKAYYCSESYDSDSNNSGCKSYSMVSVSSGSAKTLQITWLWY